MQDISQPGFALTSAEMTRDMRLWVKQKRSAADGKNQCNLFYFSFVIGGCLSDPEWPTKLFAPRPTVA